jgi:hypothetical protein
MRAMPASQNVYRYVHPEVLMARRSSERENIHIFVRGLDDVNKSVRSKNSKMPFTICQGSAKT